MAAQDAELRLKVSLDLTFFRQQLAGLGQATAGYQLPVTIKFDRLSVQNELNKLGENLRRRTYRLEVSTNIKAEIENAETLARKLGELSGKLKAGGGGSFAQSQQGAAGLIEYMRSQGMSGGGGFVGVGRSARAKAALEELNLKQLRGLAKSEGITGVSRLNKNPLIDKLLNDLSQKALENILGNAQMALRPLRGQTQTSAARSMPNLNAMLDRMAILTSNPRAAQRMLRMMPESRISTNLIGAANRQAAFQEQYPQGFKLPGFNAPKAFDPLLKAIAKDFADYARTVNSSDPWVGKVGNGIANIVAKAANAPQAQKLLPGIGGTTSPVNALEARLAAARGGLGAGGGMSGLVQQGARLAAPSGMLLSSTGQPRFKTPTAQPSTVSGIFATGGVPVQGTIPGLSYRMNQFQFPSNGMMGPSSPLGQITAKTSMFGGGGFGGAGGGGGGGGFFGGAGGFGRALGGTNLPGAGTIRELGSEFGFATKQVLLFGQAYKGLAFIQAFPGQVANAVAQLQSFRNTLNSITGSATAAADANEFIVAAVEKYNIPLESARNGFAKLFASMQPAGFNAGEIQNLFLGISKAAATFGLSADKVDRVNYAFAQMASKGQVMSEELKGQLGDVLPGAMGIFAEAAGFKGSDAIQKFNKALEDGVYKGAAMRELLRNVATQMNREFGPGAEGAAKTFQGAINRMQNAITGLYESFEPAAIGVLNAVMVPLVNTLKNATDGINAYFKGQTAATPAAQNFANVMKTLVPVLSGIGQNISTVFNQLLPLIGLFGELVLQIGRFLALPLVGQLAATYAQVLLLTTAFRALAASGIGAAIAAVIQFIGKGIVFAQVTLGMRVATQQTTVAMYQFGTAVQTVMIKSVVGIALVAISALIARFVELQNAMASVSGQAKAMKEAAKASAKLGDVAGVKEAIGNMEDRVKTYERVKKELDKAVKKEGMGSSFYREIPSALAKELMSLGLIVETSMKKVGSGYKVKIADLRDAYNLATKNVSDFNKAVDESQELVGQAQKQSTRLRQSSVIAGGDADEGGNKRKPTPYYGTRVQQLKNEFQERKALLDQQVASGELSKRQYEIDLADFKLKQDLLIIEELFAAAKKKASLSRMTAADKELAQNQAIANKESAIAKATAARDASVAKANKELRQPIIDAIFQEVIATQKSAQETENLRNGIKGLTAEQEAEFMIREKLYGMKEKDREAVQAEVNAYRDQIMLRKENARLQEQELNLFNLRQQIETTGAGLGAGFIGEAGTAFERALIDSQGNRDYATQMAQLTEQLSIVKQRSDLVQQSIQGIGDAFATTLVDGAASLAEGSKTTQEVFANLLKSLAQILADAAKQMIATYVAIGIARMFAGMGGGGGDSVANLNAGAAQYGGGAGAPATIMDFGGIIPKANGGVFVGGFQAFANGGVVQGPTLGLVGEGRYNEAVVPLPDGKSIPVELGGAMGGTNITVNVDAKGTKVAGDQGASQTLARDLAAVVDQRLVYHKRAGGLLSR